MKITSFSFTVRQANSNDGYGDNYYVNINEEGETSISHPYKNISHKEQAAILGIIQKGIIEYGKLVNLCNIHNKLLKLEEYAESSAETLDEEKAIAAAKLSAAQELESTLKSAAPQSCELGDGEVSTGADEDIDKSQPTIVITKVTEEDSW